MDRLDDAAIRDGLAGLRWERRGDTITTVRTFPSFRAAIAFVDAVADLAEDQDHHPDIAVGYDTVTLTVSTHSAGGLTTRDLRLAASVDALDS